MRNIITRHVNLRRPAMHLFAATPTTALPRVGVRHHLAGRQRPCPVSNTAEASSLSWSAFTILAHCRSDSRMPRASFSVKRTSIGPLLFLWRVSDHRRVGQRQQQPRGDQSAGDRADRYPFPKILLAPGHHSHSRFLVMTAIIASAFLHARSAVALSILPSRRSR